MGFRSLSILGIVSLLIVCSRSVAADVLFRDASAPRNCFLVQNGQAKAAIVVGRESGPFYRWVAEEVQRYLRN